MTNDVWYAMEEVEEWVDAKDPNKPKGPTSSYMFFCAVNRSKLVGESQSVVDSGRILGTKWAALSEKEKAKYTKMADKDRARYEKEMAKYVPPPPPAGLVQAGEVAVEAGARAVGPCACQHV